MIVYITTNLINNKKYIGKDSNNNPKYIGSGTLLREDIIKYGRENFKKEIIEYCGTNKELTIRESYWIKYYNAVNSDEYYNLVDFSAGWNLNKLGKEKYNFIINKLSQSRKGVKPNIRDIESRNKKIQESSKGKPKPEGFGNIISKIKKSQNTKFTQEHKNKIAKSKLGKKHSTSFSEKKYKPIIQLDKENNIIQEFKSIEEAVKNNIMFKRSNISCCLTGLSKTAYGFKWIYK
jgi:group I intron endonuclease